MAKRTKATARPAAEWEAYAATPRQQAEWLELEAKRIGEEHAAETDRQRLEQSLRLQKFWGPKPNATTEELRQWVEKAETLEKALALMPPDDSPGTSQTAIAATKPAGKKPVMTELLTKTKLAEYFGCDRGEVQAKVIDVYPHETIGSGNGTRYRMHVANMPVAYHQKHLKQK